MKLVILLYSLGAGGAERITSLLLENLAKEYTITLVLLEDIQHYPLNVQKIILGRNRTTESGLKKTPQTSFACIQISQNYSRLRDFTFFDDTSKLY